eukprot:CAMPEP_0174232844 /NCGR_PEP_ID=MMETSP0417-20130205/3022_1 /TAXON_ID=242541 /ORGANISM="Mayorella sp, Strain BSH-02190019" /LENGTH=639 /DNA_ID=CAMNT_0015310959 /DNA_START=185 /DNA_END=2104 /DNA_ORIENTATION=+
MTTDLSSSDRLRSRWWAAVVPYTHQRRHEQCQPPSSTSSSPPPTPAGTITASPLRQMLADVMSRSRAHLSQWRARTAANAAGVPSASRNFSSYLAANQTRLLELLHSEASSAWLGGDEVQSASSPPQRISPQAAGLQSSGIDVSTRLCALSQPSDGWTATESESINAGFSTVVLPTYTASCSCCCSSSLLRIRSLVDQLLRPPVVAVNALTDDTSPPPADGSPKCDSTVSPPHTHSPANHHGADNDDDDDDDDDDNTDNDDDNTDNHVNHKVTDNNNNDDRNFAHGDLVESDSEERHQGTTTSSSSLPDSVSLNLARDTEHASNSATQASTNTTDTTTTSKSTSASASTSSSESSTSSGSWWTFSLGWRSSSGESNNDGHTDASAAKKNSDTNKADDGEHRWSSIRYSFCHPGSFETLAVQPADQTLHLIEAPKVWRGTMSSTLRLRGRLQQLDELDQALIYIYVRNGDEPWRLLHEWVPSLIRHKTEPVPWPMCSYVSEAWGLKCPLRGSEISTIDIPLPTGTISSWLAPDDIAFHAITVHNSPPLENRDWYEWKDHLIDLSEKETRPLFGLVLTRFMSTLCNEEEPTHPDSPPHSDAGELSPDAFESEDDAKSKIAAYCDHIDIDQPDAASETDSTT